MKTTKTKAAAATAVAVPDFRVWCDLCYIRIAPNEDRKMIRDKAYHPHCHSKLPASAATLKTRS